MKKFIELSVSPTYINRSAHYLKKVLCIILLLAFVNMVAGCTETYPRKATHDYPKIPHKYRSHKPHRALKSWEKTLIITSSIIVGVPLLIWGGLAIAFGGSCPIISSNDGTIVYGEIYSGAVQPQLERHDYLSLAGIKDSCGWYKIRMSNIFKEIQHTNLAELYVFEHPAGTKVLVDKYGYCQTMTSLQAPVTAENSRGDDILTEIKMPDSLNYTGAEVDQTPDNLDRIIMNFDLPENSTSAKLVIKAKSTLWLSSTFRALNEMFGKTYGRYVQSQKNVPPEKFREWNLSQNIPLSVFVEKNGEWVFVDYFNSVGPLAYKEDVLSIDFTGIDNGPLKIKLETGLNFWDIDFAGMDFSPNIEPVKTIVSLETAFTNKGKDVKSLLTADDKKYYVQPDIGNEATLTFRAPAATTAQRTVILHSKGYYELIIESNTKPDKDLVARFKEPGSFPEFSAELMQQVRQSAGKD